MTRYEINRTDGVAEVLLDGLKTLDEYDNAAATELRDIVFDLADDDTIKAIILAGGLDFCARRTHGQADTASLHEVATERYAAYMTGSGLYQQVCYCKKPVIAAVQGECAGVGALLALYADLTVAGSDAQFWPPFATVAESNFAYAAFVMRLNRAKSWALRGRPLSAEQARAAGLVNWVVPPSQVRSHALQVGMEIAKRPTDGLTTTKAAFETFLDVRGVDTDFEIGTLYAQSLARGRTA